MKMNEIDKTNLSEEDWIIVGKTFNFMKAAAKAREGQPPDTLIEFECPVCGEKQGLDMQVIMVILGAIVIVD